MPKAPADRIRTLLLRADNLLKNAGDPADRSRRAREALDEAAALAAQPGVEPRLGQLIARRIALVDAQDAA